MNGYETQIKVLYEEVGLSVEQIAEDQSLEVSAVKIILNKVSFKYRRSLKEYEETCTEDDYTAAKQAISSLLYAEHEGTRLRAAKFVVNEVKGRNDVLENRFGRMLNGGQTPQM